MSFTDGKIRILTEQECKAHWSGFRNGASFQCAICAHKFKAGDKARFVYANGHSPSAGNFHVCDKCDTGNEELIKLRQLGIAELKKWHEHNREMGLAVQVAKLRAVIETLKVP